MKVSAQSGPVTKIRRLWAGDLPLEEAFWNWAVIGGIAVNLVTSILFVLLVTADWPLVALIVGYGLSIPFNVIATVGVWRSAARHAVDPARANLFRLITIVGMTVLTVT